MGSHDISMVVPLRSDGTRKRFWYDREDGHVFHRRDDDTVECFGFSCHHEIIRYE